MRYAVCWEEITDIEACLKSNACLRKIRSFAPFYCIYGQWTFLKNSIKT